MNLHSMIRAVKPLKMFVLSVTIKCVNMLWFPWISIIIFIAAHFVMKGNINDVLYETLLPFELHAASMPVSTSLYRAKSFCTRNASRKNIVIKIRACRLSITWPTSLWCLWSNVLQVLIEKRKTLCFQWIYSSKCIQTF